MSETFGTITTFLAMVKIFWDSTSKSEIINKTASIIYKNCNHFIQSCISHRRSKTAKIIS